MGTSATVIRDRLGPPADLERQPLVSLIVLNRDGADCLRRLFRGLVEHTDYAELEAIVVDNGSSDESLELLRTVEAPFPVSIVANRHNESFSDANNQGAELANGELLLFLNNDVEPFEAGWLQELVACHRRSGAGAVAATLVLPDGGRPGAGDRVQTRPVTLRERPNGMLAMDGAWKRRESLTEMLGEDRESMTLIGACLLIEAGLFWEVGGFTHGFFYGGEDDDLALKLRANGLATLYSGRSVAIHHAGSTSRPMHEESRGATWQGNRLLLLRRWGPRMWRELALARLAGDELWAAPEEEQESAPPSREEALALGFCLKGDGLAAAPLSALEAELARRGHRCLAAPADSDLRAYLYDVAVYARGAVRYVPAPGQLNVLWAVSHLDSLSGIECERYDLVVTESAELEARLRREGLSTPVARTTAGGAAAELVEATLRRAGELGFPTTVKPGGGTPHPVAPSIA